MIHGVYVRNKPKFRWRLISTTISGELALSDKTRFLEKAKKDGFDEAEVTIQVFESAYFIPESLLEIKKESEVLFN